jgi:hypothetical protein
MTRKASRCFVSREGPIFLVLGGGQSPTAIAVLHQTNSLVRLSNRSAVGAVVKMLSPFSSVLSPFVLREFLPLRAVLSVDCSLDSSLVRKRVLCVLPNDGTHRRTAADERVITGDFQAVA